VQDKIGTRSQNGSLDTRRMPLIEVTAFICQLNVALLPEFSISDWLGFMGEGQKYR